MSLLSNIFGTTDQTDQDQQLAADQAKLQASIDARAAAGNPDPYAASDQALLGQTNDSQAAAAAIGAVQGATELVYDPEQWWKDTQAGAQDAGKLASQASGIFDKFSLDVLGVFLKAIPVTVWIGAAVIAFFYLGGFKLLKGKLAK